MNTKELNLLFQRDLSKLIEELNAYSDERNLWRFEQGINNSAGNLTLHLIGNVKQFFGLDLCGISFERDRESEFVPSKLLRADLLQELEDLKKLLEQALVPMDPKKTWRSIQTFVSRSFHDSWLLFNSPLWSF
jgi:hypothetical protein